MKSRAVLEGMLGWTVRQYGCEVICDTGAKSRARSNGIFFCSTLLTVTVAEIRPMV